MRLVLTALIFVGGLFFLIAGLGFLVTPASSASGFGLAANGAEGLSTLRADMTAFFVIAAICMLIGAWRRNGDLLLVPAGLFFVALTGRTVSLFADGPYEGWWSPMAVEAFTVLILLIASRVLPHRAT